MSKAIHLFVSSSPELQSEREVVAQIVARLPLTLGWQIDHTPMPGESAGDHLSRVAASDLYVLLLGQDFAAPMGAELRQAQGVARQILAYRKRCTQSPSSQEAERRLQVDWRVFSTPEALRVWVRRDLLQALLRQVTALGLDMAELERLLASAQEEAERFERARESGRPRGEAGRSGVILGREVWENER